MMSQKMTSGWWSAIFGQGVEAVLGEHDLTAGLDKKISALRRMVLLSITITLRRRADLPRQPNSVPAGIRPLFVSSYYPTRWQAQGDHLLKSLFGAPHSGIPVHWNVVPAGARGMPSGAIRRPRHR